MLSYEHGRYTFSKNNHVVVIKLQLTQSNKKNTYKCAYLSENFLEYAKYIGITPIFCVYLFILRLAYCTAFACRQKVIMTYDLLPSISLSQHYYLQTYAIMINDKFVHKSNTTLVIGRVVTYLNKYIYSRLINKNVFLNITPLFIYRR